MTETTGSFYVASDKTCTTRWRLMRTFYVDGKRTQKSVARTAWSALGFSDSMTLEQARARATQLNGENAIKRQEQQSLASIATRVERDRLHHSVFIPEDRNLEFIKWLEENTSGTPAYVEKLKIVWGTVKSHIIKLQLLPENFSANKKKIYRFLAENEISPDYVKKQISLMNQYGRFCARITGKWYEPIPTPTGSDRELIADAYLDSGKISKESEALDEDDLATLKAKLTERQYAWIHASAWFGLRPDELQMILKDPNQNHWRVETGETDSLWVYQPKLKSVPRHKRWKIIPLLFDEQREALRTLLTGEAEMPSMHALEHASKKRLTRYAGRKSFTDLMLSRGQDFVNISMWMGHTNIERTQKSYKDRLMVHYTKTVS